LIRLKLRQFLLQAPLYILAFFQGEAEIVEISAIERPFDLGNFTTPRRATHANKLDRDVHLQLRYQRMPLQKGICLSKISYPQLFPAPKKESQIKCQVSN
jgi:hypothetical protein